MKIALEDKGSKSFQNMLIPSIDQDIPYILRNSVPTKDMPRFHVHASFELYQIKVQKYKQRDNKLKTNKNFTTEFFSDESVQNQHQNKIKFQN